jgi:hypothetical protein
MQQHDNMVRKRKTGDIPALLEASALSRFNCCGLKLLISQHRAVSMHVNIPDQLLLYIIG